MIPDQTKFPHAQKEIQSHFAKYSISLRKRKVNYKITIPQRPLYFCKGLRLGNYPCKSETFCINTNCSDLKKNYFSHSRLTQ